MDRKNNDQVELFHAFTVAEIREREDNAALSTLGDGYRGDYSSGGIKS